MKKNLIFLLALLVAGSCFSQSNINDIVFEEYFNETTLPTGWTLKDNDGDGNIWVVSTAATPFSAPYCVVSLSWYNGDALSPDNWLVTPKITMPAEPCFLNFQIGINDPDYPYESYMVAISTTDTVISSFDTLHTEQLSEATADFFHKNINLSQYSGQDVYIAFVHNESWNNFMIKLDDVVINKSSVSVESNSKCQISVYPNPANDVINVNGAENSKIEIMNVIGEVVTTIEKANANQMINVSNLSKGIYFVRVENNVYKINITK